MLGQTETVVDALLDRGATVLAPFVAAIFFFIRFLRSDRTYHDTSDYLAGQVADLRRRIEQLEDRDVIRDRRERAMMHYIVRLEIDLTRVGLDVPPMPDWDADYPLPDDL
jgi:hypothetical protein